MRMSRRAVLHGIGGGVDYSYTGTFDSFGNESQGYLVLKTSGTLTIKGTVDLCLVGGGGKGFKGYHSSGGTASTYWYGGGGGAGGYVSNYTAQDLNNNFSVTIGAGSSVEGSAGGQTSVGASFTANGGNSPNVYRSSVTGRGTSGTGASRSVDGTNGEDGVYPWSDAANFSGYRVSGCGGGGDSQGLNIDPGAGGAGGGGNGGDNSTGYPGTANTGGGGGGGGISGSSSSPIWNAGGNGGSGVVLVCWGYNH